MLKIAVISCILVSCTWADTTGEDEPIVSECISKVFKFPNKPVFNVF